MASFEVDLSCDSDSTDSVPPLPPTPPPPPLPTPPPPPLPAPITTTPENLESPLIPQQLDTEFDRALREKLHEITGRIIGEDIVTLVDFIKVKLEFSEVTLKDELQTFLGPKTDEFTSWLFGHMKKLPRSSAQPRVAAKKAPWKRRPRNEANSGVRVEASPGVPNSSTVPAEILPKNMRNDQCPGPPLAPLQSSSSSDRHADNSRSRSPHRDGVTRTQTSLLRLSRRLVKVLRHELQLETDEFAHVAEAIRALGIPRCTLEDLREVVRTSCRNGTPRFELRDAPGGPWIRATRRCTRHARPEQDRLDVRRLSTAMCKMLRYGPEAKFKSREGWTHLKHLQEGLRRYGVQQEDLVFVVETSLYGDGTPRFEIREQDSQLWIRTTS